MEEPFKDPCVVICTEYSIGGRTMAELRFHFLNVGHGDCTIVEFPSGRAMMTDINNSPTIEEEDEEGILESIDLDYTEYQQYKSISASMGVSGDLISYTANKNKGLPEPIDPIDYLKQLEITSLFRYVQTHPDMDHMSGLYRLHDQEKIEIINFWDTNNTKEQDFSGAGGQRFDERDWIKYQNLRQSESLPKSLQLYRGSKGQFYEDDGIVILSPTKALASRANSTNDHNKHSYVVLIQYNGYKVLLGGDADQEVWEDIMADEDCKNLISNVTVLKAPHHGRDSCFHEEAVKHMSPQWTVCSVGVKPQNDAHYKYSKFTAEKVLSTRFRGNIVVKIPETGRLLVNSYEIAA